LLDQWSPAGDDVRARLTRMLWRAVVADLRGDTQLAFDHLSTVIAEVEDEDQVGVFLDIGRPILPSTRALYQLHPTPFLRRLLDHPALAATREQRRGTDMPELLTDQELTVLGYLPTRLSNAGIAEQLGVSSNTIKTHLKHIYRKLRVSGRAGAVDAAERSGLL
jgi:LuxR family maltose regulon positive regulatory protein